MSFIGALVILGSIPLLFIFPPILLLSFSLICLIMLPLFGQALATKTVWLKCKNCKERFTKPMII